MSRGDEKRKSLFVKFSTNWKLVKPFLANIDTIPDGFKDAYQCPLCSTIHEETSLYLDHNDNDFLTLEDAPLQSLGGHPVCLTCKKCNNVAGGGIDKALMRDQLIRSVLLKDPDHKIDVRIILANDFKVRGHLQWSEARSALELSGIMDKYRFEALTTRRDVLSKDALINFEFDGPNQREVSISLLRTAYLLAFSFFGYSYIRNTALDKVREQIEKPSERIIDFKVLYPKAHALEDGFYKVVRPERLEALLVVFTIKRTKRQHQKIAIVLPSIFDIEASIYGRLRKLRGTVSFKLWQFPAQDYLTDPIRVLDGAIVWVPA